MKKERLHGNCHCGLVQFSIPRSLDMSAVRRCDCSLCKRRGAIMLACPIKDIKIENGAENLVHYKWNTKVATHHFCSKCGIMTKIFFDPVHKSSFYHIKSTYQAKFLPTTTLISKQALSLPMFPELTNEERSFICDKVLEFFEEK